MKIEDKVQVLIEKNWVDGNVLKIHDNGTIDVLMDDNLTAIVVHVTDVRRIGWEE